MDTSGSNDSWVGTASIFSGRQDPTWPVAHEVGKELEAIWRTLSPVSKEPCTSSRLGYRGCSLRHEKGRVWQACGGVVTMTAHNSFEARCDPERIFEKKLLASAPAGLLPLRFLVKNMRKK